MKTLLLVDDDDSIRSQFSFTLKNRYKLFEAKNRKEAYKIITDENINIALIDLGLPPHQNSYEEGMLIASKLINEQNSKVIVLTGQESQIYSKELIALGVFDYLNKPISIPLLLSSMDRADFFIDNENSDKNKDNIKVSFNINPKSGLKASSEEAQKQLLKNILNKTKFNIYRTAKILGSSRENIYYFIKKFSIERPLD